MNELEIWMRIDGFPNYAVSNFGKVMRVARRQYTGKPFKCGPNFYGRPVVCLLKAGRKYTFLVHRLVALHFIGPRPKGLQINHIDGDKTNNRLDNLEYITGLQNMRHARRIGLFKPRKLKKAS